MTRGIFKTLPNIKMESFAKMFKGFLFVYYFHIKLHLRRLTGFYTCLWYYQAKFHWNQLSKILRHCKAASNFVILSQLFEIKGTTHRSIEPMQCENWSLRFIWNLNSTNAVWKLVIALHLESQYNQCSVKTGHCTSFEISIQPMQCENWSLHFIWNFNTTNAVSKLVIALHLESQYNQCSVKTGHCSLFGISVQSCFFIRKQLLTIKVAASRCSIKIAKKIIPTERECFYDINISFESWKLLHSSQT